MENILRTRSFDGVILYPIAKLIAPLANKLNITPNQITVSNMLLRFYIISRFIAKDFSISTPILLLLTHFLDCLDGTIARMFNQTSEFGACLDGTSDKLFWTTLFIITIYYLRNNVFYRNLIIAIFAVILVGLYMCKHMNNCVLQTIIDNNNTLIYVAIYTLLRYHL